MTDTIFRGHYETAIGGTLDRLAARHAVERRGVETDESLRARTIEAAFPTMISRMAEALCMDMTGKPYSGMSRIGQRIMQRYVRAVVNAMREPSEEVLSCVGVESIWRDIVDTILAEGAR